MSQYYPIRSIDTKAEIVFVFLRGTGFGVDRILRSVTISPALRTSLTVAVID
jgi:hypothetical protein